MQMQLRPYFSRLLRFYFTATIVWGVLFGLWLGSYIGVGEGLLFGISGGLVVAFVSTATGVLYDYLFRRRVLVKYSTKSLDLVQKRQMSFEGDIKAIFQRSVTALLKLPTIKKVSPSPKGSVITGITRTTLKSFGETIRLEFFQTDNRIKVLLYSRTRLKTAIFDCGKNIENVEILSSLLRNQTL